MPRKIEVTEGQFIGQLKVLKELSKRLVGSEKKRFFLFECPCGNTFEAALYSARSGNTQSCGCSNKFPTQQHKHEKVNEVASLAGFTYHQKGDIESGEQLISLNCIICKNSTKRRFYFLTSKKLVCNFCKRAILNLQSEKGLIEDLNNMLLSKGSTLKFHSKSSDKSLYAGDLYFQCEDCGVLIKRRHHVVTNYSFYCACKRKSGFKQNLPAILYLLSLYDEFTGKVYYKYGITNNLKERFSTLKRYCKFKVEVFMTWEYSSGLPAMCHESVFKRCLKSVVKKEDMSSGYTETFESLYLEKFLSVQSNQYLEYFIGGENGYTFNI